MNCPKGEIPWDFLSFYRTDATNSLKTSVSNGKSLIASAITDKGISTSATATFDTMASNIRAISTGYKVNTDTWVQKRYSDSGYLSSYAYVGIPPSMVGKNIFYGFCAYKNSSSDPYSFIWYYNGSWYVNGSNECSISSSGYLTSSKGLFWWVYGVSLSYCFIAYI